MSITRLPSIPLLALAVLASVAPVRGVQAAEPAKIVLTIKDHQFSPATVTVPAGQRFQIQVTNQDATPEEFESHELKAEKIIAPGATITVNAGPLKPGSYAFGGEYHQDTAKGTITAVKGP